MIRTVLERKPGEQHRHARDYDGGHLVPLVVPLVRRNGLLAPLSLGPQALQSHVCQLIDSVSGREYDMSKI